MSSRPSITSTGTSGSGPDASAGACGASRPAGALQEERVRVERERDRAVEREERVGRDRLGLGAGLAQAFRRTCRAGPGQRRLLAHRRGHQRERERLDELLVLGHVARLLVHEVVEAVLEPQQRSRVAVDRGADRARVLGADVGAQVALPQAGVQVALGDRHGAAPAAAVVPSSAQGRRAQPGGQGGDVARKVGGDAAALTAADLAQDARRGGERVEVVRVLALRLDDRVEDQALDAVRVLERVGDGDLRAVGDAVQVDLVVADAAPDRLDVLDGVTGRIERPLAAELPGALLDPHVERPSVRLLLEPTAVESTRLAGAALVHHVELPPAGQDRRQVVVEVDPDRRRALPRPAGKREDSVPGGPLDGRALDMKRDPAGNATRTVDRNVDRGALERALPALGEAGAGSGGRSGGEHDRRGDQGRAERTHRECLTRRAAPWAPANRGDRPKARARDLFRRESARGTRARRKSVPHPRQRHGQAPGVPAPQRG